MERREPRKRIAYVKKGVPAVEDQLEFKENKSSHRARKIIADVENFYLEIWFDKHYHDRHQHGDEDGAREGIAPKTVESLVRKSTMLNVVIEAHFLDISRCEITVKTAMCVDDFKMSTGQYFIEFQEDGSVLKKLDNGKVMEVSNI